MQPSRPFRARRGRDGGVRGRRRHTRRHPDGPGEFREAGPLIHLPHDTLGVWDGSQQRLTLFSPAGDHVRGARLYERATNAQLIGAFGDASTVMADFRLNVPDKGFEVSPAVFTRYSRDGALIDSLGSYPWMEIGIFDAEGRMIARIGPPPHLRVFEIGRDYVLGMQPDADDVERVVMYPLRRG